MMWNRWAFLQVWLQIRLTAASTVPAPIDVGSSQSWDGDDGEWSSFPIRVGTPAQNVRVLISTAATNTWVVQDPLGCQGFALPNCADTRGGLFSNSTSTTWVDNGDFGLYLEDNLNLDDAGHFGFDTVGLGWQGSGGPTINDTVVAEIVSANYILGRLGLNPRPTNFSTFNDPQTSYLSFLYEQNIIPSLSYSYSAGAKYRNNGVLGSLTLGGYNEGLYAPNDLNFPFYFDQTRDLSVGVQAITSQVGTTNTSLLPSGILSFIDSTVTQIWLPREACDLFATTYGLTWDNNTNLYFLNKTQHTKMITLNPNITFTLGLTANGGKTADITFPYAAFDLNISYPTVATSTYYFPIRRAINETQYTLGRTFLQEAYLTVDYLRNNFSISQRTWDPDQQSHIVAIPALSNSTSDTPSAGTTPSSGTDKNRKSSGISTGAIAGIAIAVVVLLILGIALFFFLRLRKRRATERESMLLAATAAAAISEQEHKTSHDPMSPQQSGVAEIYSPANKPPELQGGYYDGHEAPGTPVERRGELDAGEVRRRAELEAEEQRRAEMEGSNAEIYELEAPHGMHEMSNLRPMREDPRWGETTSPVSSFNTPVRTPLPSASGSRISRREVGSTSSTLRSPRSPPSAASTLPKDVGG